MKEMKAKLRYVGIRGLTERGLDEESPREYFAVGNYAQ